MSQLSRLAPQLARTAMIQHQRNMATASVATDPIQKIFIEKIREFKASNKGLDAAHQKASADEHLRLKRVFQVDDENKLSQLDHKFASVKDVSLHDLDTNKELRQQIASGEYQKQLVAKPGPPSELIASIPEQVTLDLHLPPLNKPDFDLLYEKAGPPAPLTKGEEIPDYENAEGPVTPHKLERIMCVKFGPDMPTIHDDKSPERDVVNFPRLPINVDTPPTRHHIIPESWFRFFYPITGATGPYAFAGCFGTFLFSKEWLVMEHELLTGMSSTVIFTYAIIKYGPRVTAWMDSRVKREIDGWNHWRKGNMEMLDFLRDHYSKEINKAQLINDIYDVRQQDIDTQLELEYRSRLKTVYDDTKRRLNYLVAVAESQRQIASKNMVNWVITNAVASIGQKGQEAVVLDNCISNLKSLASKNPNSV